MENTGIKWITVLLAVGVIVLGVFAYVAPQNLQNPVVIGSNGNTMQFDKPTVSISGNAESKEVPDEVVVYFSVQTKNNDVVQAQEENRKKMDKVIVQLKQLGLKDEQLQTDSYNVYQETQWNQQSQKSEPTGYVVSHRLVVTTNDLELVGKILDAGIKAGVNNVDTIMFQLSDKKQKEVELKLLEQAVYDAKEKASILASASDMKLGKVLSLGKSSSYYPVYSNYKTMSAGLDMAEAAPSTQINPEDVTVSAVVNVVYMLE